VAEGLPLFLGLVRPPKLLGLPIIEEHGHEFQTNRLCQVLDVSARGLRAYRNRPASRRQRTDMVVLTHIKEQSRLSLGSYGRPRMTEELKELGLSVGHRRVGRLTRENGIRVARSKKYKVTTDSNHAFNIAPNLLNRNFSADNPNQKWAGDISYVWTREEWLYLAVILDLHSRRVIGWAVRWPSSNTSTGSTIHAEGTQHWAGKARSLSNGKWHKRASGAAQKRDRSSMFLSRYNP